LWVTNIRLKFIIFVKKEMRFIALVSKTCHSVLDTVIGTLGRAKRRVKPAMTNKMYPKNK